MLLLHTLCKRLKGCAHSQILMSREGATCSSMAASEHSPTNATSACQQGMLQTDNVPGPMATQQIWRVGQLAPLPWAVHRLADDAFIFRIKVTQLLYAALAWQQTVQTEAISKLPGY